MTKKKSALAISRRTILAAPLAFGLPYVIRGAEAQGEVLRFGVADPLTGPSAIFGLDQMQAVRWAVEDINAAGGVNGRKLEAIIVDHQARPDVGIAVVTRLIQVDKVPTFITAFSNVVSRFNQRYLLSYVPTGVPATGWHPIEVHVKDKSLRVMARRGYEK